MIVKLILLKMMDWDWMKFLISYRKISHDNKIKPRLIQKDFSVTKLIHQFLFSRLLGKIETGKVASSDNGDSL